MRFSVAMMVVALLTTVVAPGAANTFIVERAHKGCIVDFEGGFMFIRPHLEIEKAAQARGVGMWAG